ncbi:MAG TPA: hypothetical protein VKY22_10340 [Bradyrhizobium sp.]|nr:hypothetical protein [Bradyrhizobium sp.]
MPRPLKIKIFMDVSASVVEEQVNAWLAKLDATIIKSETVVTSVAKGDSAAPFIVVTIWYELPASDQERPGFRAS